MFSENHLVNPVLKSYSSRGVVCWEEGGQALKGGPQCRPQNPRAEPWWGSPGKSTEFIRKIKVKIEFGGSFGGDSFPLCPPCAPPPPGSGTASSLSKQGE